jgi:type IV secretory pathway TrbD component
MLMIFSGQHKYSHSCRWEAACHFSGASNLWPQFKSLVQSNNLCGHLCNILKLWIETITAAKFCALIWFKALIMQTSRCSKKDTKICLNYLESLRELKFLIHFSIFMLNAIKIQIQWWNSSINKSYPILLLNKATF